MENKKISKIYECATIKIIPNLVSHPHKVEIDFGAYGGMKLDMQEIRFIKESFEEIITYCEKRSKETRERWINKKIKIKQGRFKDFTGIIEDVDIIDNERPLMVKLNSNPEIEGYIFINWSDIEDN